MRRRGLALTSIPHPTLPGGAGGKGTWGVAGDPACDAWVDKGDPNYDDELDGSVLECSES